LSHDKTLNVRVIPVKNQGRKILALALSVLAMLQIAGCASEKNQMPAEPYIDDDRIQISASELKYEVEALSASVAAVPVDTVANAPGRLVKSNTEADIDYSNTSDGYVMARYAASTDKQLRAQVKGPTTTYTYHLKAGEWAVFPLSDGNGDYQITIYKNVSGSKYAAVLSVSVSVELKDEFAPFIHSNQYVNFDAAPKTVAEAAELTANASTTLDKVTAIYNYVVKNISYDQKLAASVKSGYLPDLDSVLEKKTGICFDYAALMTGMLRSQSVPCKMVVGYAGKSYHAWINVWSEETGWINAVIYFDGETWQRMDPTFASSAGSSEAIMKYIGNGENYTAKYFY
jgi:transglutaminase-like putative cysteine protease